MVRRSRNKRKPKSGEIWKLVLVILLALTTVTAAGAGIYIWITTPKPKPRDKVTLCLPTPPKDIIVAVLDTTDGLPAPAQSEALTLLTDIVESSPIDALFELRTVDTKERAGHVVLTVCNPGDGRDLSELNAQPKRVQEIWRERFRAPLLKALEGSLHAAPGNTSPLLATFQGIAQKRFSGAKVADAHKRLIIVSDMIEHVPGIYTQYPPADLSYGRFKASPHYRQVHTDLHNASVDILYVDRGIPGLHTGRHIQFWLDWIADNNGRIGSPPLKLQGAGKS
jgi:hypothetical protein